MNFRRILELDARLSSQMRVAEKPGFLRTLAIFFAHSGDSWFWWAALILFWFLSNESWKKWETVVFFGILGLAGVVQGVKLLVKRQRPAGDWGGIYRNTDPHSFPSGHAARAFMIAILGTALAPPWLALILWVWAPLVAMARVAMGVHYLSDIIAGAVLGIIIALLGLQFYQVLLNWFTGMTGFYFW